MSIEDILKLVKADLHISVDETTTLGATLIAELRHYVESADAQIRDMGIDLNYDDVNDCIIVKDYASWMYRRRTEQTLFAMPRYLQLTLNNRLFHQKAGDE